MIATGSSSAATVVSASGIPAVDLPPGIQLQDAAFSRVGADLVVRSADGETAVVRGFYLQTDRPQLLFEGGEKHVSGDLAARLAGPLAPGQVAQAGGTASLGSPIGKVENVGGTVVAIHTDGSRTELRVGDPVYQGDILESSIRGGVGIVLADETTFSMGPDGRMVLDELVYDPGSQQGSLALSVLQGVFTFVSGHVAKTDPDAMVLETPIATIGIRGTQLGFKMVGGRMEVVNLPHSDGSLGEITVSNAAGVTTLNFSYQGVQVLGVNVPPGQPFTFSPQGIVDLLGPSLAYLPPSEGANNFGVAPQGEGAHTTGANDGQDGGNPSGGDQPGGSQPGGDNPGDQPPGGDQTAGLDPNGLSPPPAEMPPPPQFGLPEIVPTIPFGGLPPPPLGGPPPPPAGFTPPPPPPPGAERPEQVVEQGGGGSSGGGSSGGGGSTETLANAIAISRADFGVAGSSDVDNAGHPRVQIVGEINSFNDIDIFSVPLQSGETLTLDIDFGQGFGDSVDTIVGVYDGAATQLAVNDDASTALGGTGSIDTFDAFVTFTAPSTSTFFVVVSAFPNFNPFAGGSGGSAGDYVLQMSITPTGGSTGFGATPTVFNDGESGVFEGAAFALFSAGDDDQGGAPVAAMAVAEDSGYSSAAAPETPFVLDQVA